MRIRSLVLLVLLLAVGLALACPVSAADAGAAAAAPDAPVQQIAAGATPTPHPILSDLRVRQAIAYCTDKAALLASVYPDLTPAQRQALIADTFIRPTSWAYTAPATTYAYAPATGKALLDQAGWTLGPGATYRTRGGKELVLTLRTTTANFRITFLTVFETQMEACGIRVIREHLNASWFFGADALTGIEVRDFELAEFAWVIPDDNPGGQTIYACNQTPTPANNWQGQNYPGWCNTAASNTIGTATDTGLSQPQRKAAYAIVIDAAAAELPSLPLFWRDDGTGQPSETYEHIDFNLETYSQDAELVPAAAATLNTTDYAGNTGSVAVPAGAVAQDTTLSYYPLMASARELPANSTAVSPFRLTAALAGVPQAAFEFSTPAMLTVRYDDASLSAIWDEAALNLYRWDESSGWEPAQEGCPEGQRYYHADRTTNTVQVQLCHLSEYALIGGTKHVVYLPLVLKNYTQPLRINLSSYPATMDPQKGSWVVEIANIRLMYEGLTSLDENLQTVPGAAESWVYNADATELTFTLRGGLQYSDGTPLNAKRFAYSILRNIDPTTNGEYAGITDEISGAWAYRNADVGNLTPEQLQQLRDAVEVRALDTGGQPCASYAQLDCRTLRLRFERPASYFHTVMSMWVTFPAKEELIAAGGAEWWRSPQHQIGNGPFVMTANTADTLTRYTPNTRYWRGLATYGIEYRYMADSAEAFAAYRADQLDIIAPGPSERGAIEGDPVLKQQLLAYPGSCTIVIKMSLAAKYTDPAGHEYNTPFMDKKVREAFAYAFDAEGWAKDVDQGRSTPTWTWIPPGFPGYDATTPLKFDPDLARQKLAESSYGGPANLNALGLKLTYGDTELNRVRSEWLVANYKKHLDVDIALDPVDTVTYSNLARNPATFPLLARQGWCADYPDPQNWLSVYWRSDSAFAQRQGYTNDLFDQLTAQADASPDQAARMALYKQAQQVLLVDVPAAFGYNSANVYLVKPRVQGIKTTPQDSDWAGSMVPLNITLR